MRGATPGAVVGAALSAVGVWVIRVPMAAVLIGAAIAASLIIAVSVVGYVVAKSAQDSARETLKLLIPWGQGARES
jgi:hypothetical protein